MRQHGIRKPQEIRTTIRTSNSPLSLHLRTSAPFIAYPHILETPELRLSCISNVFYLPILKDPFLIKISMRLIWRKHLQEPLRIKALLKLMMLFSETINPIATSTKESYTL